MNPCRPPSPVTFLAATLVLSDLVPIEGETGSDSGADPAASPVRLGDDDVIVLLDPQRLRAEVVRPGGTGGPVTGGK